MKKKILTNIISFVLGVVLTSSIGVAIALTYKASDITFTPKDNTWNVTNVQSAIDDLNSNSNYEGSLIFTPSTSIQTIPTNNKILKSNITINAIPSTYKNLTPLQGELTSNDLLLGKKAYNSNGEVVEGNIVANCVKGTINTSDGYNTSVDKLVTSLKPSIFLLYSDDSKWVGFHYYNKNKSSSKYIGGRLEASNYTNFEGALSDYYTINNNGFYIHNWPSEYNISYMLCE